MNYLPNRQYSHHSWSDFAWDVARCETEYSLARPFQATVTAGLGLDADREGRVRNRWSWNF
ncbi:MAG: hypothetical protein Q4G34_01425 [Micrococcus sp.]|nr:hypothetical protein [Micrococcus sp.]